LASLTESAVWRQSLELATLGSEFDDDYAAAKELSHIFGGFSTLEESASTRIIHNEDILRNVVIEDEPAAELGCKHIAHRILRIAHATIDLSSPRRRKLHLV
jgi:hypothetical protein